jgi:5-oxoprolinase (ATP-hydrolysing)
MISKTYFPSLGVHDTPVILLKNLKEGMSLGGPALLIDETQTLVVEVGWEVRVLERGVVFVKLEKKK